jgi:hypothetical protein
MRTLRYPLAALLLLLVPAVAHADKKKLDDKLELSGRLFARAAIASIQDDDYRSRAEVTSARVGASYRWERLRADIEFELTTQKLKDAFIRWRVRDDCNKVDVRAGQFKMPFSAIQLASAWRLPLADRGLLSNVMNDSLQLSGRHVGADVTWELPGERKPTLIAGVFQGIDAASGDPLTPRAGDIGEDVVVRGTIEPVDGLEIGAAGGMRSGAATLESVQHRWMAEIDATLSKDAGPGHARAWVEAMVGSSWMVAPTSEPNNTMFMGGRGLAAWRWHGEDRTDPYIEAYAMAGVIDMDRDADDDLVIETTGGITYGRWDVWRIQAEVEAWRVGDNAPEGTEGYGILPANTSVVLLQAGAHF